jgi:putative ABC transport system ATP-binding protein
MTVTLGVERATRVPDILTAREPIVRADQVVKTYVTGKARFEALKNISLDIMPGEVVGVMGPSGCGKTTMLNCLSGLDSVTSGKVFIEGKDLAGMSDNVRTDYRARRMGFVFQVYNLLPVLNAVENTELPLLVSGMRPRHAREQAMEALRTVGLEQWAKHRPAELSGGQRQRVTIARSLVNDPAIVWADEPTGALDSKTAHEILDLMLDLNAQQGLTIVIVTHDPAVGRACQRIVEMRDGEIISHA